MSWEAEAFVASLTALNDASRAVYARDLAAFCTWAERAGPLYRDAMKAILDGNLGYVRTGELDRFGFDAGLGYNIQVADWMASHSDTGEAAACLTGPTTCIAWCMAAPAPRRSR